MKEEIASAVVFLTAFTKKNENLKKEKVDEFSTNLSQMFMERFRNHWYDDKPTKGQGYRCIRINENGPLDPVIVEAANKCGLTFDELNLPAELTLWVDPQEVCCRFGENRGSCCTVASFKNSLGDSAGESTSESSEGSGDETPLAPAINIDEIIQQQSLRQSSNDGFLSMRLNKDGHARGYNANMVTSNRHHNVYNRAARNNYNNYQHKVRQQFSQPPKKYHQYQATAPVFHPQPQPNDKFHWVRGHDLIKSSPLRGHDIIKS